MNTSTHQIFQHLHDIFGHTIDLDLQTNEERMKHPRNQEEPIETVFQKLEESIEYAQNGN